MIQPINEAELALLSWLRGRGNLTVSEACIQGAEAVIDSDRTGVNHAMRKLAAHKLIKVTTRKSRVNSGNLGARFARVRVFHTGQSTTEGIENERIG